MTATPLLGFHVDWGVVVAVGREHARDLVLVRREDGSERWVGAERLRPLTDLETLEWELAHPDGAVTKMTVWQCTTCNAQWREQVAHTRLINVSGGRRDLVPCEAQGWTEVHR